MIAAIGMYRYAFKGKGIIDSLLYIPIVIPEIVMGISLLAFFSLFHITTGILTLIIAHVTFSMPFVVITVRSRIAGYDKAVEDAAMDLGATRWRTLRRITIPVIAPGSMAGAMLALTLSLDDAIVSFFTCGINSVTLPIKIYSLVRTGVSPDVNALSTVIVLATMLIMILSRLFEKRSENTGRQSNSPHGPLACFPICGCKRWQPIPHGHNQTASADTLSTFSAGVF